MKLLRLNSTDPYLNLAIEEFYFKNSEDEIFIIWQNEPTVVIGKNQNAYAEINIPYLKERGIKVARRITGGGAVYHDLGNVNYSYIGKAVAEGIDFSHFTEPIIGALRSMGVPAELSGRNDILAYGKKISGNAQSRYLNRVLHHGTLLFNADLSVLSTVLKVDPDKIKTKALRSVASRVSNIIELTDSVKSTDDFINRLYFYISSLEGVEEVRLVSDERIDELYKRNSSEEWIFSDRKLVNDYSLVFKKRFDFGIVRLSLSMKGEVIDSCVIDGDFFGEKSVEELAKLLIGETFANLKNKLSNINFDDYISKMKAEDFYLLLEI